MSTFLEIRAVQMPFFFNQDENNRRMFSCNYHMCVEYPSGDWEASIAKIIVDASLGTLGTDLFIGPAAVIPAGDGPLTLILETAGTEPMETHNNDKREKLSMQIITRAMSYNIARTRARAIFAVLDGVRNTTVVP